MYGIRLTDSLLHNISQIRNYFHYHNLTDEGLGPKELVEEVVHHLNEAIDTNLAIELFYGLSDVFENVNTYKRRSRLYLRDHGVPMIERWLSRDFDPNAPFVHQTVSKLYGVFSNFDVRMPERLHDLMKDKLRQKVDLMNAKEAARVLGYYARTADFITADSFDELVAIITEREGLTNIHEQIKTLLDFAIIDTLGSKGVVFNHHTPKSAYEALLPRIERELGEFPPIKFRIAKEWFTGKPFFGERGADPSGDALRLRKRLEHQGLSIQDRFGKSAEADTFAQPIVRTGVDFVITFGNASVGVVSDTQSGYVSMMGQRRIIEPNGKSFLNSAYTAALNQNQVVVRLVVSVAENTPSGDLAKALEKASHLPAGIYGMNNQTEVVPLSHLKIVA